MTIRLNATFASGRLEPARRWAIRAANVLRRIIGAPDYDRYLTHMLGRHPERPILTRDQFMRQCLADRYNRPGSRCC